MELPGGAMLIGIIKDIFLVFLRIANNIHMIVDL